ncbi:hypothetical protein GUITHDRAFT_155218 [Guillardia theta CCMP2712]|uniref:Uncharacterized protein n=1 Tax=Guillardia theta (strain CCMP2712) TaxID=905079 RepID=L1IKS3_GUITC|nr:hypothetical protein GUITHDRAFT_155218 [Guillardia theta CCMP2712]EKX36524.1 hypothetical protein GUITHDRAFT_155218 [Guillardia theta CCMP2712]|eukprot:XP_005823504.1 hypothetical protein GUITHDRAFT_155218 [Guillardia theta CCMP2712]
MNGNFWYSYKQSAQIKQFYDTCIPECATDEDVYDSKRDLCRVTDGVLVTWLNGDGQKCATGTKGERAIRTATASLSHANGYFYAPDASGKVRRLLESCHSSCAKGDVLLHDKRHCQVMNSLALRFISTGVGTCDRNLQARRMISTMGTTRDVQGAYMYPKELGNAIEQFYLSCMQGWNRKGRAGIRTIPHSSETVGGKPLRDDAKQRRQARNERRWEEAVLQSDYN